MVNEAEGNPVLELHYHREVVGWLDCGSAFEAANADDLYLHAAIFARLVA
jgi:hypothetical protein